ncbi:MULTISPECIES: class I SAM-dependent methyltransferase [unclassified Empedobacter]|uniref:class I SAM-dependent methyltransferase n=1 Tax=unclassified Empedobacter TaxID=2643773 RepID=UPI0025B99F44|nr:MULTISPECIES: class I SAM-dependent methyltransferase [unclassified Empedobacter]
MNYNFIAPYYHSLSQLIFLNRQHQAHFVILKHLKENDKILWVGGGAGKFIAEIEKLNLKLEIDYVDFSSRMIDLAQKEKTSNLNINFIGADIFDFETDKKYDVVMTTFLFDHFNQPKAEELFNQLNSYLKVGGLWFYVDFVQNQKGWQKSVTNVMLSFFRIVIGLDISQLPKMQQSFMSYFEIVENKLFFKKYIESIVYQKK